MHAGLTDLPTQRIAGIDDTTSTLTPLSVFANTTPDSERKVNVTQKQVREFAWTGTVIGLLVAAWFAAVGMGFFAFFLFDSFYNYLSGS